MSWLERIEADSSLREFVDAEVARAGIEIRALKVEVEHWKAAAQAAEQKLKELKKKDR